MWRTAIRRRRTRSPVALSNLGDVTCIAPIEDFNEEDALDYLGVRARLNVTSLTQGAPSFQKVEDQWINTLQASRKFLDQVIPAHRHTNSVAGFTEALLHSPETGIQEANDTCNAEFAPLFLSQKDFARLPALTREALAETVEEYFGLDLRLDHEDPTLGVTDSARGSRLYTGVARGDCFGEATSARTTIRLNGGMRFTDLDVTGDLVFAAERGRGRGVFEDCRQAAPSRLVRPRSVPGTSKRPSRMSPKPTTCETTSP